MYQNDSPIKPQLEELATDRSVLRHDGGPVWLSAKARRDEHVRSGNDKECRERNEPVDCKPHNGDEQQTHKPDDEFHDIRPF